MPVQFHFADSTIQVPGRKALKSFLETLFKKEGRQLGELSYVFCSDEYLLGINRQFLQHDYYTDIITFDLSSDQLRVDGEIYISTDRVRENALQNKVSLQNELHRVIFHGALHLCGYKDKRKQDKEKMTQAEDKYLSLYFR